MKKKVLTVDDSVTIRKLVTMTLESADYEVLTATDGQDALSKLKDFMPDLILCDINMPNMGGLAFVRAVKQSEEYKDYKYTPIVMLTTENEDKMRNAGQEAGASAWVVKPFMPERLLKVVEKIIGADAA